MRLAPISLDHYWVTELSIAARESFDSEQPIEAKLEEFSALEEVSFRGEGPDKQLWQIILTVSQQPAPDRNFPYEFRVTVIGYCQCLVQEIPIEEQKEMVRVNGSSMLYGVVREIIRENTSRGPWQPIMLPTVSFFHPTKNSNGT